MNPEYLQAIWTFGLSVVCCLSVVSELISPKFEALPPEELDAAIIVYDEISRLNPNSATPHLLRGNALLNKQDFKRARVDFDEAIRLAPESAEGYLGRGQAHQNSDDVDAAIADCNEAIRLKPGFSLAYVGRGHALFLKEERATSPQHATTVNPVTPCDAERPANMASADPSQALSEQAFADFDEAIRLDPNNSHAYLLRGFYWHKREQFEPARLDFDEAIRLQPNYSLNYHFRARLLSSMRKSSDALADYDRAIELNPNASQALCERAILLMNRGKGEEALADADRAVSLDPMNRAFYDIRAVLRFATRDFGAAISDFNEILKLAPRDSDVYWKRSLARVLKSEYTKGLLDAMVVDDVKPELLSENFLEEIAVQVLSLADERLAERTDENGEDPRFATAFRDRGLAFSVLAFSDKAINALNTAIRLDESSSLSFALRGRVRLREGEWARAIEDFDAAIQLNPNDASFYTGRGMARSEIKEWTAACDDFNTAIELDSHQIRAYARRGAARQALGELDLAIADYDRVIAAGPFYKRSERKWKNPSPTTQANADGSQTTSPASDKLKSLFDGIISGASGGGDSVFLNSNDVVKSSSADFLGSAINSANPVQQASIPTINLTTQAATSMQIANGFQTRYSLRLDPDCAMAYRNRAACREIHGEWSKAIEDYEELSRLAPKDSTVFRRIAWLKAACPDDSCRNGAKALEFALRSIELTHATDVDCLVTIAAAYAEIDDFENAVQYQSRAHAALITSCQKEFDARREHFQSVVLDRFVHADEKASVVTDTNAVDAAIRACEKTGWNAPKLIEDLADAYANSDQLEQAIDCQEKARDLKLAAREESLLQVMEQYRAGKPCRDHSLMR